MAIGRPTKLTPKFLKIAEEVLNDDINAIIYTDQELRDEINDRLEPEERISDARWEDWKAGKLKNPICQQFRGLMKKALRVQKSNLFEKFREDEKAWQKYAWIIERKFGDWNLRNVSEVQHKGDIGIGITLSNYEKKIENVIDDSELHSIAKEQNQDQSESSQ